MLAACGAGFEVHVIREGTRSVEQRQGDGRKAIEEMSQAGAIIEGAAVMDRAGRASRGCRGKVAPAGCGLVPTP